MKDKLQVKANRTAGAASFGMKVTVTQAGGKKDSSTEMELKEMKMAQHMMKDGMKAC